MQGAELTTSTCRAYLLETPLFVDCPDNNKSVFKVILTEIRERTLNFLPEKAKFKRNYIGFITAIMIEEEEYFFSKLSNSNENIGYGYTLFEVAVKTNHLEIVQNLIQKVNKETFKNVKEETLSKALKEPAKSGNYAMASLLLNHKADPYFEDETIQKEHFRKAERPIAISFEKGDSSVFCLFIESSQASLELIQEFLTKSLNTMASLACDIGERRGCEKQKKLHQEYEKITLCLLKQGFDPNWIMGHEKEPLLLFAAWRGTSQIMSLLIERLKLESDPSSFQALLNHSLYKGVGNRKEDVVAILLENGADPNCQTKEGRPFIHAGTKGNVSIIRNLVEKGASAEFFDEAFFAAINLEREEAVRYFLTLDVDPLSKPQNSEIHLLKAAEKPFDSIFKQVLDAAVKKGVSKELLNQALEKAAAYREFYNSANIAALLEKGADPFLIQHNGKTLFLNLIEKCYFGAAKEFLKYDFPEKELNLALVASVKKGAAKMAKLLLEKGACPNQSLEGGSLLKLAISKQDTFLIRSFLEHGAFIDASNESKKLVARCLDQEMGLSDPLLKMVDFGAVDEQGNTLLMTSALEHSHEALFWIEFAAFYKNISIDHVNLAGETALILAIKKAADAIYSPSWEPVQKLIESGASFSFLEKRNRGALLQIPKKSKRWKRFKKCVRESFNKLEFDPLKEMDENGRSPLELAAYDGTHSAVREFLFDLEEIDLRALHNDFRKAIDENNQESVVSLLKVGVDPNQGTQPLLLAAEKGSHAIVKSLLGYGVFRGQLILAMEAASQRQDDALVSVLLQHEIKMKGYNPKLVEPLLSDVDEEIEEELLDRLDSFQKSAYLDYNNSTQPLPVLLIKSKEFSSMEKIQLLGYIKRLGFEMSETEEPRPFFKAAVEAEDVYVIYWLLKPNLRP